MGRLGTLAQRAGRLKTEIYTIYCVFRNPRTPWYAKLLAAVIAGYAFSPVDLIPDFIPVLGSLDDLLLIPLGVFLVLKLVPDEVTEECRAQAEELVRKGRAFKSWVAGVLIAALWILVLLALFRWVWNTFRR